MHIPSVLQQCSTLRAGTQLSQKYVFWWSRHEERHDDRYFDCDAHVDRASEHKPKERHRDLEVDKEMLDVPEKNVDF